MSARTLRALLFDGTPNAVASARSVGQGWSVPPDTSDADCNHFEYFASAP